MIQIAYVDWDGLVYYDGKIKQYISDIADGCLKAGGKIPFAQLPRPSYDNLNYVYKITDSFTSTNDFDKPGYKYEAGALVQVEDFDNDNTYRYTVIYETVKGADASDKVDALEKAVEEHSVDIGAIANDVDALYALLEESYAKKSDIPNVEGLASEKYVDDAVSTALTNIEFDDKQVITNTNDIQQLKSDLEGFDNDIQTVERELDTLVGDIGDVKQSVDALQSQVSDKSDVSHKHSLDDITDYAEPDLSPYAEKEWVEAQNYLKEHQDLSGYAKKADLPKSVSELINDSGYATTKYVNEELSNKAYKEHSHDDKYELKGTCPTKVSQLENDKEYVTEFSLQNKGFLTQHQSLEGYAKTSEVPTKLSQLTNDKGFLTAVPNEYITEAELNSKGYLSVIPSEYITSDELDARGYLTHHQSLDGYAKITDIPKIPTKVSAFTNDAKYATVDQLSTSIANIKFPETDLSNYYTKDKVYTTVEVDRKLEALDGFAKEDAIPTKLSDLVNDKGYITSIPSEYVTEEELLAKKYLTSIPGEYITETELNAKGYLTQHQSLSGYAKLSDLPEVPAKISELQDDRGLATVDFVTTSIANIDFPETDLSNYYTKDKSYSKLEVDRALGNKANVDDLPDFSTFATKTEVKKKLDASTYEEDKPFYALKTELFDRDYNELKNKPEIPSVEGLASEDYVRQQIAEAQLEGGNADLNIINGLLSNYYRKEQTYSKEQIDNRIPSLDGYATEQWVANKHYLTSSDISNKADKGDIITDTIDLTNSAGFITKNEALSAVAEIGYITDVSDKLDVSVYETDKATFALAKDIPDVSGFIKAEDVEGLIPESFVTSDELAEAINGIDIPETDLSNYYNKGEVDGLIEAIEIPEAPTNISEFTNDSGYITISSLNGYATEGFVAEAVKGIDIPETDLSNYYTKGEVDELIPTDYITNVDDKLDVSVYNNDKLYLATKDELNAFENLIGYVATDDRNFAEVIDDTFAKKTDLPSLNGYATEDFVNQKILEASIGDEDVDLTNYYTKDEVDGLIPTVPTKVSELENDANYLTEHIDISGKLDISTYNEEKETFAKVDAIPKNVAQLEGIDGYVTVNQLAGKSDAGHKHSIDEIDGYVAPDYSDYYTKGEVEGLIPTDYLTSSDLEGYSKFSGSYNDLTDKPEIPSVDGLATEKYVDDAISNISLPDVDTSNLVTNDTLVSALLVKADDVPFTTDMRVTTPLGGFIADETLQNLTVAQILTKLLGLIPYVPPTVNVPESTPEVAVDIITNNTPTYILAEDGSLIESEYGEDFYVELTPEQANLDNQEESFFYQVINQETNEVEESGYQVATIYQENDYLTVLVPNSITNFHPEVFDGNGDWTTPIWVFERNPIYDMDGYTAYTVPAEYEILSGIAVRIVIDN